MTSRLIFLLIVVCAAFCKLAQAADPQHDRIVAERAAANAKFAAQRRDCESRFVVASCMEAAHKEQRATLSRLRQEELEHDDAKRRSAGAAREQELREKSQSEQARASEPASAPRHESAREPPQPHAPIEAPKLPKLRGSIPGAASAASSPDRRSIEEHNEAKFEAKERALQVHRQEVEQRNAQRAAQGKIPPALPLPEGAASTAR
jgi:colicin import membrane protein